MLTVCFSFDLGKYLRGGVPDAISAARGLLNDWNTGKIKYCTHPPEDDRETHISASIVSGGAAAEAREFDVDNFEAMETEVLQNFSEKIDDVMEYKSSGPVQMAAEDELDQRTHIIETDGDDIKMDDDSAGPSAAKRGRSAADGGVGKKVDAAMLLEGNQTLNRNRKAELKKQKKRLVKTEKKVSNVADVFENFSLGASTTAGADEDYSFEKDFE